MRRSLRFLSRSIAILCSILFVVAMVLVLLLETAQYALLSPRIYRPLLEEQKVYDRLPSLMAEQSSAILLFLGGSEAPRMQPETSSGKENPLSIASATVQVCARQALGDETYQALYNGQRLPTQRETRKINACIREERRNERLDHPGIGGDLTPVLEGFSTDQWEELIRLLLPAEDLRLITEAAFADTSAYLHGQTDTLSVSLMSLKERLTGEAGGDLSLFLLSAQPPCTEEQEAKIIAGDFENGGGTAIYCAASGEALRMMLPAMQNRLEKVASQIPAAVVLIGPASSIDIPGTSGRQVAIRNLRDWLRLSPLASLALLLLVTLLGVRSVKGWLRWWGIPAFIAGLIALAIGLAAGPALDWGWENYASRTMWPVFSSGLGELGQQVFRSLTGELGKWVLIEAGLILLLGAVAIMRSNHMARPRSKLKENKRAFAAPELTDAEEAEARQRVPPPPRRRDDTGYT